MIKIDISKKYNVQDKETTLLDELISCIVGTNIEDLKIKYRTSISGNRIVITCRYNYNFYTISIKEEVESTNIKEEFDFIFVSNDIGENLLEWNEFAHILNIFENYFNKQ